MNLSSGNIQEKSRTSLQISKLNKIITEVALTTIVFTVCSSKPQKSLINLKIKLKKALFYLRGKRGGKEGKTRSSIKREFKCRANIYKLKGCGKCCFTLCENVSRCGKMFHVV